MNIVAPVLHAVGGPIRLEEVRLDEPRAGEVRVQLTASGVCHSCLHVVDGSHTGAPLPIVLGDEGAGIVESVGQGVESVSPGDHVIISWAPACGRCRMCVAGRPGLCERQSTFGFMADGTTRMHLNGQDIHHFGVSTYAPAIVVPESCAIRIRDDMPLDRAALIGCCVPTGVGAVVNTAAVRPGQSVAVFGCGGVGLNSIQGARLVSASQIIAVDLVEEKLQAAEAFGATHAVNASVPDVPAAIRSIVSRGVDCAIVAVGSARAIEQAWASLAPGGVCVVVGRVPIGATIPINSDVLVLERRLTGSVYGSVRPAVDFPWLVDAYMAGRLMIDELITQRYTLADINEAHRALAEGENLRGLIVF